MIIKAYNSTSARQDLNRRLVLPAKTQISLRIRVKYTRIETFQRWIKETLCHTEWMYKLIGVFAGRTGLIVGFAVRWLFCELRRFRFSFQYIWINVSALYLAEILCLKNRMTWRWSTKLYSRPRWLSWMRRPTGDQEVAGSTPAEVGNILSWRLIMKYFLRSFSPFRWFKKDSCQFLAKDCAQYWLTA